MSRARLRSRALALRNQVIEFARAVEKEFGKNDDLTIFARNAAPLKKIGRPRRRPKSEETSMRGAEATR